MVNGSEIINNPFNTIFSPFTDLMGSLFWLFPVTIIAAALFVKTKSVVVVGSWLLGTGMLMTTANIFSGLPMILDFYLVVIGIGITFIISGLLLDRRSV